MNIERDIQTLKMLIAMLEENKVESLVIGYFLKNDDDGRAIASGQKSGVQQIAKEIYKKTAGEP